ncbi:MAG: aldo/keto reductase, partial [Paludibacteraceae bacterium]|nr:aldo/keto reductase [Paludibacteraceae bacterium]
MNRREFLKTAGGGLVATSALLSACNNKKQQESTPIDSKEPIAEEMTYRINPNTNDKVSLLGYGMMRLPVEGGGSGRENPNAGIDQEMVNKQVDYAIEHGVNYFDTSPAYCQGRSEHATGIALSRHPRSSYFIAT